MSENNIHEQPEALLAVGCDGLLGEARVEAVKGYMENRLSLVTALEKKSSYYDSHERDKNWLVEEIKRVDEAVASLLASPNDQAQAQPPTATPERNKKEQ